ncbi:hypothetical protein [Salinicola socius]|uniref:Uncharacterized protein n=1 Tax=Salinicola socius TaxID=404433 RepID=A0A1Q8SPJ1_9GAMM|nr:hypothetical protein [Salinicola socius]OLO03334.1 hypothetical protein BTW07_14725 [Salinicola socius]
MPQPLTRANAVTQILGELQRMEARRGCGDTLGDRRLQRSLASLDQSSESEVARRAIQAQWDRDFPAFDAAAEMLLDMDDLSEPGTTYVNFALMCHYALNADLCARLNRRALQFNRSDQVFVETVARNAWHAGDIKISDQATARLGKLNAESYEELRDLIQESSELLVLHGVTHDAFQQYVQCLFELIRGFVANKTDVRLVSGVDIEDYEDGHQELLVMFDLDLDDDTLDAIDEALLELRSDADRVNPALNKCVGVLVRDYPQSLDAEAC